MAGTEQYELTEEVFDVLAPPLVLVVGLTSLQSTLEALTDVDGKVLQPAFAAWSPAMRERASVDLREQIQEIREVLDQIEEMLPTV